MVKDSVVAEALCLGSPALGGGQLPSPEATQTALWRGPHKEELRPPIKSHVLAPSWTSDAWLEPLEKRIKEMSKNVK